MDESINEQIEQQPTQIGELDLSEKDIELKRRYIEAAIMIQENRFADPRECHSLEDVAGKEGDDGIAEKAKRIDWVPRKMDVARMADVIQLVQIDKSEGEGLKIVDIAGHSGFLDRLLLDELDKKGVNKASAEIVDPDIVVTTQAREHYLDKEPRLSFVTEKSDEYVADSPTADVVICSWMRPEMNLRPDIEKLNPRVIIFVKDLAGDVGQPESFENNDRYEQTAAWLGFSGANIDSIRKFGYDEYDNFIDNVVLIMTRKNDGISNKIKDVLKNEQSSVKNVEKYPWENELPETSKGIRIHDTDDFDRWTQTEED